MFFMGFKHGINIYAWLQTNLHTHKPLIDSECGVFFQKSDEQVWAITKIKWRVLDNQNLKHGVNKEWMILSWLVTCLSEGCECSYLTGICFRYELRWVGATQVRCWKGELRFGNIWVMLRGGLWVGGLNWKALKLRNGISIFGGRTRLCSRVFLAF